MRRSILGAAVLALALALPASALAYTSPTWNLDGTYTISFTETVGPDLPGPYPYSVTLTGTSDMTGAFTGTGFYGGGSPSVTVTGTVTGWDVILHFSYLAPFESYNPWDLVGKIDQNGGMSGTAVDGQNRYFNWVTTAGSVGLFSPRCTYGTYPDATRVWEAFAPATGGTVTTTPLDPTRDYFVEASGTYFANGAGTFDIEADAEYSQDAYLRANSPLADWTDYVRTYEGYGEGLLELKIDDTFVEWGAYNANHRYTLVVTPTGSPLDISAYVYDLEPLSNNTGGLCVAVYVKDIFDFTGFFAPVDNLPTLNAVKAGSAIPVKFSLDGDQGLDIFAAGYPKSTTINCDSSALSDPIETTDTAGASTLTYDPVTDQYHYVWKTSKAWAGTCRQLEVQLVDGQSYFANFNFK